MAKLSRSAMLGVPYYFSTALGMFPAQFQTKEDKTGQKHEDWPFRKTIFRTFLGLVSWLTLTGVQIVSIVLGHGLENPTGLSIFQQINTQLILQVTFYSNFLQSKDRLVKCFNTAYCLLQQTNQSYPVSVKVCLLLSTRIAYYLPLIVQTHFIQKRLLFQLYSITGILTATSVEVTVTTLCTVAQVAYEDINDRLKALVKVVPRPEQIEELVKLHWRVGQFANSISKCFGQLFLIITISSVFWIIFIIISTVKAAKMNNFHLENYLLLLALLFFTSKIGLFCVLSQIICNEAQRPKYILQCICAKKEIPEATMEWVKIFETQVDLRKVYLTACSSFDFNISLFVNLCNIVLTYTVCLLQMA